MYQNEEWVCTGGSSSRATGGKSTCATRVVELSTYKGELQPLTYSKHWNDVDAGNRKREYTGMLVTNGKEKRKLVFVGEECVFKEMQVGMQLKLF
ncbi:hypothetical protein [Spirosoma validum]|uniref:Uncharacterized protein n=1 Tax=Spirosoma validum TaxID=2771355 RepID=A0A927GDJ1_9BACT|nr:hypothetical protein [Spirosoma validum]MBD2753728.1 hypothetical protein [Spirosoma validum]